MGGSSMAAGAAVLLLLLFGTLCYAQSTTSYEVEIGSLVGKVQEEFLSVTLDAAQIVGAPFWDTPEEPFDFNRTRLINLATALSPAVLRIGGTTADEVYYDMSDDPVTTPPEPYSYVLTRAEWDNVAWFTNLVGFKILYGINGGPGPRANSTSDDRAAHDALDRLLKDEDMETVRDILLGGDPSELAARDFFIGGPWTADNARVLWDYTYSSDAFNMYGWELGNEPNLWLFNFPHYAVTGEQLARDFGTFYNALAEYGVDSVVGPDVACQIPFVGHIYHGFVRHFLETLSEEVFAGTSAALKAITWHWYPLVSDRCPNLPVDPWEPTLERNLELKTLNRSNYTATFIADYRQQYQPNSLIHVGETGGASCGGQVGVSDRFSDTFWWVDQLGYLALFGNSLQARQTLTGSNYGLIDEASLVPNPDYWGSYIWSSLVGPEVIETTVGPEARPHLRAYARCLGPKAVSNSTSYTAGMPVVVMLNLLNSTASVSLPQEYLAAERDEYVMTAPSNDLASVSVLLNGQLLQESSEGVPPPLVPNRVAGNGNAVQLPPQSIGFIVFEITAEQCA